MATITLKVDAELARLYQEADTNKQEKATLICNVILKELLKPASFREIVNQIREEAIANGLTPEILAELLEDE